MKTGEAVLTFSHGTANPRFFLLLNIGAVKNGVQFLPDNHIFGADKKTAIPVQHVNITLAVQNGGIIQNGSQGRNTVAGGKGTSQFAVLIDGNCIGNDSVLQKFIVIKIRYGAFSVPGFGDCFLKGVRQGIRGHTGFNGAVQHNPDSVSFQREVTHPDKTIVIIGFIKPPGK